MRIDQGAAKRFVKSALWQPKKGRFNLPVLIKVIPPPSLESM
jgi:hypothetical protein